jgi:hypothetical protein
MICFPKRGIKIEYLDANTLSVSMTDEPNKTGFSYMAHSYSNSSASLSHVDCDKFYLGAYKGYTDNGNLYSSSGFKPSHSATIDQVRITAHHRGTGYEQSGFFQLTFRQVMYLLKYKGQNAQIAIGRGYVDVGSNDLTLQYTGVNTNTSGMDYGTSSGMQQMKLFGLEDFYGNIMEWIDGIRSDSDKKLWVADGNFNDAGTGYTDTGSATFSNNIYGYLRYPAGTNLAGFNVGSQTYGDASTYFCDMARISSGKIPYFGGYWNGGDMEGVFRLDVNANTSTSDIYYGSRLMYMHPAS